MVIIVAKSDAYTESKEENTFSCWHIIVRFRLMKYMKQKQNVSVICRSLGLPLYSSKTIINPGNILKKRGAKIQKIQKRISNFFHIIVKR